MKEKYKIFLDNLTNIYNLKQDPLRYVLNNNLLNTSGLILEFGCWKGQTIDMISDYTPKTVYGFDTFKGIEYQWGETNMKKFELDKIPTTVHKLDKSEQYKSTGIITSFNKNVTFIQGLFSDTLPKFMKLHNNPISFIHIDCDVYESTKTIFDCCGKNISNGCIIVFDDLFNYKNFQNHEIKAFYEWSTENNIQYEWIGSASKVHTTDNIDFLDSLSVNKKYINHKNIPRFNDNNENILFNDKLFIFGLKCQAVVRIIQNPSLQQT